MTFDEKAKTIKRSLVQFVYLIIKAYFNLVVNDIARLLSNNSTNKKTPLTVSFKPVLRSHLEETKTFYPWFFFERED